MAEFGPAICPKAPRFGLIHLALPLFDLAVECYPDEHRNLDWTRSNNFHAGAIRKEKPSEWPGIRRGHALSAAKALGLR